MALTQADLIFPSQSLSLSSTLSSTLSSLKRSALSIHNRLSSIAQDSSFVLSVAEAYGLPLIANERCGGWYIPPEMKRESCYFKSTDGHVGEWAFSLRRLNLRVLDVVEGSGGCVIVDSTRRGKSMPDALSKTIPIWCCVVNRAVFGERYELYTPPNAVSESERVQIESRVDGFVKQFLEICKPDIELMRRKLRKPLRPIWVTQASSLPLSPPVFEDFCPIVLCTASRRVHGGEASEGGYIQGAADDQEAWACGLTSKVFWENKDQMLSTNAEDLPGLIEELMKNEKGEEAIPILLKPTQTLYISSSQNVDIEQYDAIVSCTPDQLTTTNPDFVKTKTYLQLNCTTGKLGSRDLRTQLVHLPTFFETLPIEIGNILICDPTPAGNDLAVGAALVILCLYTDDNGKISNRPVRRKIDKTFIKQRLTWITTSSPLLNPSRATLQSVNAFLMPDLSASVKPPLDMPTTELLFRTPTPPILNGSLLNGNTPSAAYTSTSRRSAKPTNTSTNTLFHNLQNEHNPWTFTRTLASTLPTHPSGTVTGVATFTPLTLPTSLSSVYTSAALYAEEGEFVTTNNLRFTAKRKYIYLLRKEAEGGEGGSPYIAVHFHEEDKECGIGGLFVEMGDVERKGGGGGWEAGNRERHLCGKDLYAASWRFGGGMVNAGDGEGGEGRGRWWEVRYDVKGPKKDYVSETRYTI
ncbi:hypothetical protein CC78DRAFT_618879 [Lojkania enalia]|uniref:Initiator tRNA phosphoribosyl transferase n=1 Tax=Lojkania enalia TaxID=147567 RepID=A0A9P4K5B4_9PLEO|nr:hypothetical protein CC78DRAFT_618879 [Didymosphaeria enalia]